MLKTKDLFLITKIIKKMGLKDAIKEMMVSVKGKKKADIEKLQEEKGMELIFYIIENLHIAEQEVYQLLANYADKSVKEIENQSINDTFELIKKLFDEGDILNFFKMAMQ
ncbi:MAG: hypothetical protein PWQ70_2184 [Clostridiales bacterium]|nr:hypothetical protein [Clostridiales bacterium]